MTRVRQGTLLQVQKFDIAKLLLVFVVIALWVGVDGILNMLLELLFVDANQYIKLGYYVLLTVAATLIVYSVDVSPALVM